MSAPIEGRSDPKPEQVYNHFMGIRVKPKPANFAQGKVVPEGKANPLSQLLFSWLTPILLVSKGSSFGGGEGEGVVRRLGEDDELGGDRRMS